MTLVTPQYFVKVIASLNLSSSHYQITDNADFLKASYSFCQYCMWHNQVVARQNLFLHNNMCLLINIVLFHIVSMEGYKVSPAIMPPF